MRDEGEKAREKKMNASVWVRGERGWTKEELMKCMQEREEDGWKV